MHWGMASVGIIAVGRRQGWSSRPGMGSQGHPMQACRVRGTAASTSGGVPPSQVGEAGDGHGQPARACLTARARLSRVKGFLR